MPPSQADNFSNLAANGLWRDNPISRQVLGICSTLAVTNLVLNTAVMCAGLIFTTALSSMTISVFRDWTPRKIRMMVQTLIIAFYVILIDIGLQAYWMDMSRMLGPYVGLIITNCIVMGRAEAFAGTHTPGKSFVDGAFMGLGYSFVLLAISVVRELLGQGAILGYPIGFLANPNTLYWDRWIIMVMPPGAFFTLAVAIWILRSIRIAKTELKPGEIRQAA